MSHSDSEINSLKTRFIFPLTTTTEIQHSLSTSNLDSNHNIEPLSIDFTSSLSSSSNNTESCCQKYFTWIHDLFNLQFNSE